MRTLAAAGRSEDAARAAHQLFAMAAATGQPLHTARLLLLLARVHREAGAPMAALPYALSCAAHARQLHADLLAAEAAVLLAQLWCDMGAQHAQHAQRELETALPTILAHGGLDLQARAQASLAEALMAKHASPAGLAGDAEWCAPGGALCVCGPGCRIDSRCLHASCLDSLPSLTPPLSSRALSLLGEAARLFLLLEDDAGTAHCRYLSALLADALGQTDQRDAAAAAFRALQLSAAA